MSALVSVTPSNIDVLINQIKTACDLESLTDARARIEAARAWSRVHKQVKKYRLELLRLEVQALVRIVELGGIDTLTAADQKAAQALAQMSEAERAQLIAESGTSTTAAGMMRTLWRTQELESENARLRAFGRNLAKDPHFAHLDEEGRRARATEQVYRVEAVLRDVLDERTFEGEPFTVADVAAEILHRATRGDVNDPTIEEGMREVVRAAIKRAPIVTFEGVSLPRLITATTEEGVYVRIPVENARLCDFAEMIEQRQVQLEQDRARLNALSKALAHLRMIAGADDGSRIGDLLALDLIGGAA